MVVWEANMGWELSVEMVDRGLCVMVWELYVARDGWQGLLCQGTVARGSLEWVGRPPCTAPLCILWLAACLFQSSQWCLLSLSGQSTKNEHMAKSDHGWMWQRAWPEAWPYSRSWKAVLVSGLRATRSGPLRPLWALVSPAGVEGVGTGRQKEGTPILSGASSIQTSNDGAPFCQVGAAIGGWVLRSQCYWSHHVKNRFLAKIR